jgi:hypothetical protein
MGDNFVIVLHLLSLPMMFPDLHPRLLPCIRRPLVAEECDNLQECQKWRLDVSRGRSKGGVSFDVNWKAQET